jgi:protein gp37
MRAGIVAENSKIEWTTHTFNPWIWCQKVSPGCDRCYAEAMMDHRYHRVQLGPHGSGSGLRPQLPP